MRGWWKRFLERIAEANGRQFGSQPPDCCRKPEQSAPPALKDEKEQRP